MDVTATQTRVFHWPTTILNAAHGSAPALRSPDNQHCVVTKNRPIHRDFSDGRILVALKVVIVFVRHHVLPNHLRTCALMSMDYMFLSCCNFVSVLSGAPGGFYANTSLLKSAAGGPL